MSNFFMVDDESVKVKREDKALFRSPSEFSMFITTLANENGDTITHTLLQYCEDRDLDPEDIACLVSKPLKERLAIEMQESGLLSKESSAEFDM